MSTKRKSFFKIISAVIGCFFVIINLLTPVILSKNTYAVESTQTVVEETTSESEENSEENTEENSENNTEKQEEVVEETKNKDICHEELAGIGWIACTATTVASKATDALYGMIKGVLVINPVVVDEASPVYTVWQYCLNITNTIFVIFLLIIIFSQITGIGINNYGIKRALPKLIIAAILVNISFLICSLGVEISNIIGNSLRGIFESVGNSAIASSAFNTQKISIQDVLATFITSGSVVVGGTIIAAEHALIWLLIPIILGAVVSIFTGLITIALRQAVVVFLIIISPLAFIAYILPNTEHLFKKWKDTFISMLIFYPMFSILFGATNLGGLLIMSSAKNAITVVLGIAVQIFPFFFSWKLMKMSNTILGTVSSTLNNLAAKPLATNRAWAESHRRATRAKMLAGKNSYTPSSKLAKFLSDRAISRDMRTREYENTIMNRGMSKYASKKYRNGNMIQLNKYGKQLYEDQARNREYLNIVDRDVNNFNEGFGQTARNEKEAAYLGKLDGRNVHAYDNANAEAIRGAMIEHSNAEGRKNRFEDAYNANLDEENINNRRYTRHEIDNRADALSRYDELRNIVGDDKGVLLASADASYTYATQAQLRQNKMLSLIDQTVKTQDVVYRMNKLTLDIKSSGNMDMIIPGLRILNKRGDTDIVLDQINNICMNDKLEAGTYAAQQLANFAMFEVKDNSPFIRRFGKYINLETARIFNENLEQDRRHKKSIDLKEYVLGEYEEENPDGTTTIKKSKRSMAELLEGTPFSSVERLAFDDIVTGIKNACRKEDGSINVEKFNEISDKTWNSIASNVIGDQFSYKSGSEQIKSFAQYVTGQKKGKDGKYSFEMPFTEDEMRSMTQAEKDSVRESYNKRKKSFVKSQVPNQIARTKSDVLLALKESYREDVIKEHGEGHDEKFYDKEISKLIKKDMKDEILGGLANMVVKGYQGDSKANLIELFGWNDPYVLEQDLKKAPGRNKKYSNDHEGTPSQSQPQTQQSEQNHEKQNAELVNKQIFKDIKRKTNQNNSKQMIKEYYDQTCNSLSGRMRALYEDIFGRSLDSFTSINDIDDATKEFLKNYND